MEEFFKRWNFETQKNPREEYKKFLARISNVMAKNEELIFKITPDFCQKMGIIYPSKISEYIVKLYDELEFFFSLQVILDLLANYVQPKSATNPNLPKWLLNNTAGVDKVRICIEDLLEAINISDINLTSSSLENDQIILHPRGERLLDEELVNQVLSFLDSKSNKHFIESLEFYSKNNATKSAESLRRCLEEFLRFKLKNEKGLQANIQELQKPLKSEDKQIRNIIFATFNHLDQYFNENSKHKDGEIDETENEFLIYQLGTLLRYINRTL